MRICGLGWRADAALRERAGDARVVAALSTSVYVDVGDDVLWIGAPDAAVHARAIHVADVSSVAAHARAGDRLRVPSARGLAPWRAAAMPATDTSAAALRAGAARLRALATGLGKPRGFGAWLLGIPLTFPLDSAQAGADELSAACAADDAGRAAAAATTLIGLGPGLTPAGDDFVGGVFFARALLSGIGAIDSDAWGTAASVIETAARRLTHRISATLLGDLLVGEGWEPLHDLAAALANADDAGALGAARELVSLGHSSGWDLLAGFVVGARV